MNENPPDPWVLVGKIGKPIEPHVEASQNGRRTLVFRTERQRRKVLALR